MELGECVAVAAAQVAEEVMPEKLDLCVFLFAQVCPACVEVWEVFSL